MSVLGQPQSVQVRLTFGTVSHSRSCRPPPSGRLDAGVDRALADRHDNDPPYGRYDPSHNPRPGPENGPQEGEECEDQVFGVPKVPVASDPASVVER